MQTQRPMPRLTELGYPVVEENLHHRIFGKEKPKVMSRLAKQKAEKLLKSFKIPVPVDYPDHLYDGPLPLPELRGENLREHFESIASEQVGHYKELGDSFSKTKLPSSLPGSFDLVFEPGWTRYTCQEGHWVTEPVPYPLEEVFTFDTETFVHRGAYPIIGTALSAEAVYVWLASELINSSLPEDEWDQWSMIPIGENRLVIGHNVSYDRVRAQEGYSLDRTKPENFYFDTLSAHIGVSGLASGQRWLYILAGKDPESLTEEEKRKLRYAPKWLDEGSTNSLVATYNFHVYEVRKFFGENVEPLSEGDKKIRDLFVKATDLETINGRLGEALEYAIKDAFYTAELFQALWPKYLDATPSMVALCGHYHLNGSIVPLASNWKEWIQNVEHVYEEHNAEMTQICKDLMWKCYEEWKDAGCEESYWKNDPWLSQLKEKWEVKIPAGGKSKYAGVPTWVRPFIKDSEEKIGVKSRLAHLLLRLEWKGKPITWVEGEGWCYLNEDALLTKIPHPKGTGENVGSLFGKEFVEDFKTGLAGSKLPEAQRAIEIAVACSYWTGTRKRVMDRIYLPVENPHGSDALVTLPGILAHGTVTRRTVENLFAVMCSTKPHRIGTELKTRVQAPEGWKIISADYDAQELNIAGIYADRWEGGYVGCSPMGYSVLSGSKEAGTDPHSALAKLAGIDRDTAKIAGFSVLYGAGVKAVQMYIRRRYPDKSPSEVKNFAYKILESKKGRQRNGLYEGGSDSGAFNMMEEISMRSRVPQLPCLGTKISTAMRPAAVGDEFRTGRTNWAIQASGAEILSITLTAVGWLAKEYKIPYRFLISIHDELHFMTPQRYAEQFAVLFQMAHMYTWALFHSAVGIPELPLSRAFFSSVAIDDRIRKSPKENTTTLSNPGGAKEDAGIEYSMSELDEIGAITKLTNRYNAIRKGLI